MPDAAPNTSPTTSTSDRITLRFLAAPSDVTAAGTAVAAGRVLEWIDRAAFACAVGWSGSNSVTSFVGDINFTQPIRPGDLIEVHARVVLTGRTSMHILVSVESSDLYKRQFNPAMHCLVVMVALDEEGKPREVPQWTPWSDADKTLSARAQARIEPRKGIQAAMESAEYSQLGTTPRIVFRFLAAPSDVNVGGNAHGGTVMRWIDEAAYACASSWSSTEAVSAYSGGIHFERPIHIGHIVEVDARIIHTGARSMHVSIRVRSGPTTDPHGLADVTQCLSVFIVPKDGHATPINPLVLISDEDRALDAHAEQLIELRKHLAVIPNGLVKYA